MAICMTCGSSFEPKRFSKVGKFCSLDCYYALGAVGPRKATVKGQRLRMARSHPIAPPSGLVAVSRLTLYTEIGPGPHQCHWCKQRVAWTTRDRSGTPSSLIVDHLDWDKDNNDPSNLVPSCHRCNALRTRNGNRRLKDTDLTVMWSGRPTKAIERACEHCGAKFLIPPSATRGGRGRFCSRSCARSSPSW